MFNSSEKLVLSGSAVSKITLQAALEVSGSEHPSIVIDTSPKVSQIDYQKSVEVMSKFFEMCGMSVPTFLDIESTLPDQNEEVIEKLKNADIMMVTGGSTLRAYQRWHDAGVAETIVSRVKSGDLTGYGASAGAMIWFHNGYSDSMQYEVGEGDRWEYIAAQGAGIVPAWVTAHYSDTDGFNRDRSAGFASFLHEHYVEWNKAIGIDSDAAITAVGGLMTVMRAADRENTSKKVHLFSNHNHQHEILEHGDTFSLT